MLDGADYDSLSKAAVSKVSVQYSQHSVAMKYIEVYNQALAFKIIEYDSIYDSDMRL